MYIQSNASVSSRYWDGERFFVPGKSDYVYITAGPVDRVALCPAGTNDSLYMGLAETDGEIRIRRYAPDPARDPENPDYNWNGRSAAVMWPELGVVATGQSGLYDDDAVAIARHAVEFLRAGVDARHLRGYRQAAEREASLYEQLVTPRYRQRNPQSRADALRQLKRLDQLGGQLRAALTRQALRHHFES